MPFLFSWTSGENVASRFGRDVTLNLHKLEFVLTCFCCIFIQSFISLFSNILNVYSCGAEGLLLWFHYKLSFFFFFYSSLLWGHFWMPFSLWSICVSVGVCGLEAMQKPSKSGPGSHCPVWARYKAILFTLVADWRVLRRFPETKEREVTEDRDLVTSRTSRRPVCLYIVCSFYCACYLCFHELLQVYFYYSLFCY